MIKETQIQKSILDYLRHLEPQKRGIAYRSSSMAVRTENGSYCKSGRPGVPDITMCYQGKFYGIEVKTAQGKQSKSQKEFEEKIKNAGGEYLIVRSVDEVIKRFPLNV